MVSLVIVLLILLPPLVAIWLTQDNLVNAPHYDDFTFLDDWLKFKKGELTWAELFNVHLEHRITVPRMIAIGLHIIGGPDLRWQNALTLLLMLGMLWNITVIWCRGTGRTLRDSWLPLFLMSATLFCTTQWQTLLWPILFEIMIPIWALTQMVSIWTSRMNAWTALALSVLLGAASMLCFASGLLLWVLLPLCIAFIRPGLPGSLRRNLLLTWLGLFIVALGLYFGTNYHNAAPEAFAFHFTEQMTAKDTMTNSLKAVAEDPLKAVLFVCATLGTHLCRGMNLNNVQVAEGLGALSIIALTFVIAWIILRGRNRETLSKVSPGAIVASNSTGKCDVGGSATAWSGEKAAIARIRNVERIIWQNDLSTEGSADLRNGKAPVLVEVDDAGKASVRVEQEHTGGVVHRVVTIVPRHARVFHPEIGGSFLDLFGGPCQPDDARIEVAHVVGEGLRRIAVGVDRDQGHDQPVGVGPQFLKPERDVA